ncbi:hypothetical protein [Paraglaciecola hydrolytica]|nr:hypothetical protein [Paraglaciecola hydrolytica]
MKYSASISYSHKDQNWLNQYCDSAIQLAVMDPNSLLVVSI